jgi:hypothetical protein
MRHTDSGPRTEAGHKSHTMNGREGDKTPPIGPTICSSEIEETPAMAQHSRHNSLLFYIFFC